MDSRLTFVPFNRICKLYVRKPFTLQAHTVRLIKGLQNWGKATEDKYNYTAYIAETLCVSLEMACSPPCVLKKHLSKVQ